MTKSRGIAVVGLGYVGLNTALSFCQKVPVIAFDIDASRINELSSGYDRNGEVSAQELNQPNLTLTVNLDDIKASNFYIVAVPTHITESKIPDLHPLHAATRMLAGILKKGDILVYESTVFPGATEDECIPLLESISKLKCGVDFGVGFSPERVNPSDKDHIFKNIPKIVSAESQKTCETIAEVFKWVVDAGVHIAPTIKVAEAAKVIENIQRDINISLMNELAMLLNKMNIDTGSVIDAMRTKWNFLPFQPGLVGGHCIGINSYYLLYKARKIGFYSHLIPAARFVNEGISHYVVENTVKLLIKLGYHLKNSTVCVLGFTYKENCSDIKDNQVIGLINELKSYYLNVVVHDPIGDPEIAKNYYGVTLLPWEAIPPVDAFILAVSHNAYKKMQPQEFLQKLTKPGLVIDIKEIFSPDEFKKVGVTIWRL